ncbi:DUF2202 domain-containing protein [Streptomyces sp. NBC_00878]|uniref:DUF2202 domain-containing protein n=1 Tax=Streptomyces sp. NBC_00878 TaxID=2975854 RepID=UPI00224FEB4C|nr:DUF2202 domain-containing protein [Streptomyces sp. NBC_00878]MCX4906973.1 DUF2202 domain-containing protein [Streptomyces sp. NBC_00878]
MKRNTKLATAIAAAAAVVTGGILIAGPATAGAAGEQTPSARSTTQSSMMNGQQHTHRHGDGTGVGDGNGPCSLTGTATTAPSGTLSAAQKTTLARMAEEEKLAHDLYTVFAARYDARVFDRIAAAETHHLDAVRTLLDRYDVTDPTTGKATGDFADTTVQATYDRLLKQGTANVDGALKAGLTFETDDIAALTKAQSGLDAPDVEQMYANLLAASRMHQAAFESWLVR